jgi:hypothetical protein
MTLSRKCSSFYTHPNNSIGLKRIEKLTSPQQNNVTCNFLPARRSKRTALEGIETRFVYTSSVRNARFFEIIRFSSILPINIHFKGVFNFDIRSQ